MWLGLGKWPHMGTFLLILTNILDLLQRYYKSPPSSNATFQLRWDTQVAKGCQTAMMHVSSGPPDTHWWSSCGSSWQWKASQLRWHPAAQDIKIADRLWGHVRVHFCEVGVLVSGKYRHFPHDNLMIWLSSTLDFTSCACQTALSTFPLTEWSGVSQEQLSTLVLPGTCSFLLATTLKSCPMEK